MKKPPLIMTLLIKLILNCFLIGICLANNDYNKNSGSRRRMLPVDIIEMELVEEIDQLWIDINQKEWLIAKRKNGTNTGLVKEFKRLGDKIERVERLQSPIIVDESVVSSLWPWAMVETLKDNINGMYGNFRRLQENLDPLLFSRAWEELAQAVLNNSPPATYSMTNTLTDLQTIIIEKIEAQNNLFQLVSEETSSYLCNMQQSPQQLIYNLYNTLQLTQLKAYTMINFSWMLLRLHDKGNFTHEAETLRKSYIQKVSEQVKEAKKVMESAKTEIWKCDPRRHVPEETYTEITKLLQGFVVNEVDLNNEMTCREDCSFYQITKQHGCYKNNYCSRQKPCRGDIISCSFVDADMWICPSDSGSNRRYDWIEYENGRQLGLRHTCSRAITKVDSWWRWLFWHCSYCMCLCDDKLAWGTERYFNLRPTLSDTQNNKVLTGLRFVKKNGLIHLQIQEGTMLPKGNINESTVSWKEVDNYSVSSAKEGEDYHTLTWKQRAIDFDDLKVEKDHVLTGVKFRTLGHHLNLEIQASKFDFETGKLINAGQHSQWISNDNTDASFYKPRKKIKLISPDLPIRGTVPSKPDSDHDTFMEFETSDMDADASQSTVPFLDVQPVAPYPHVPLQGAGIYHKGQKHFGGFIAPKVFTMDFANHLIDNNLEGETEKEFEAVEL